MKPFKSFLKPKIEEYLQYRKALGYSGKTTISHLLIFDGYIREMHIDFDSLQPLFLLNFRENLKGEPAGVNGILSSVRGFFEFLLRQGRYKENPMKDVPYYREKAYIPFVFSSEQIDQLLLSIQQKIRKEKKTYFKDFTLFMAILCQARCGLRISEPLRALRTQYRNKEGTLYIEKTKFNKDRLIAIPKELLRQIDNYLALRNSLLLKDQNPYLFPGNEQNRLSYNQVNSVFKKAVKDIGLEQPKRIIANTTFGSPRTHSLRHSFAVNTLKAIKERGQSPQKALPILAAYMGHTKYRYTSLYLKVLNAELRQGFVDFNISHQEEI